MAAELAPRTPAYREIWLGRRPGRRSAAPYRRPRVEPLYGKTYLPRKFKVAIGLPGDNCVDLYAQDVGLLALCENFQVVGYNVLVGGGMGSTPGRKTPFPPWPSRWPSSAAEQALDVVRGDPQVFRDFGNRSTAAVAG